MCAMELPTVDASPGHQSSELNAAPHRKATEPVNRPADVGRPEATGPPQTIREREQQRWADRLTKLENPPSNRGELKTRLNHLEPGHPSSPWEEDGTPKPPAPRLSDLETP